MAKSQAEILENVRTCLSKALGVDREEIQPSSSLTRDLSAESIDFLDIVFRLEKSFGVKIPRGDLFPEQILTNPEFVQDGRMTPRGLAELKRKLTAIDFTEFEKDPVVKKLGDLFTVEMIVRYLTSRLAQSPSS